MIRWCIILTLALCYSQQSINFNYESKYGEGISVENSGVDSSYKYFENVFDINYSYNDLFFYTQLEYSDPPIYGTTPNDLYGSYFVEYSGSIFNLDDYYSIKYGHIQTVYGYGLTVNMFQDQSADIDNRIKGWELKYSPYEMVDFFLVSGSGGYGYRTSADLRMADLFFDHDLDLFGAQFYTGLGDFLIIGSEKKTYFDYAHYDQLKNPNGNRMAMRLNDFYEYVLLGHDTLGFMDWHNFSNQDGKSEVELQSINLGYSNTLGNFDIYFENEWNKYDELLSSVNAQIFEVFDEDSVLVDSIGMVTTQDKLNGSRRYFSMSGVFFGGVSLLYEHKDYDMLYYLPIASNPPLGFNESSSVLMSRVQHGIDFSDETGHQLEVRFGMGDVSFLINMSGGMRHSMQGLFSNDATYLYYDEFGEDQVMVDFQTGGIIEDGWMPFVYYYPYELEGTYNGIGNSYCGQWIEGEWIDFSDTIFDEATCASVGLEWVNFGDHTNAVIDNSISFFDVLGMDWQNQDLRTRRPFRDMYAEISGWNKNNSFYYKLGYNLMHSYDGTADHQTYTIPSQFVFSNSKGNSLTTYLEYQHKKELFPIVSGYQQDHFYPDYYSAVLDYDYTMVDNLYLSLSYHIRDYLTITYFEDKEKKSNEDEENLWTGIDVTFELSPTMQFSIFKGSQKGGLVCANGICAEQPSFEDGIKLTFRALF